MNISFQKGRKMVVRSLFGMNRVLYYCNKLNLGIDYNLEQIDVKKYILDIYSDRYMLNDVILSSDFWPPAGMHKADNGGQKSPHLHLAYGHPIASQKNLRHHLLKSNSDH